MMHNKIYFLLWCLSLMQIFNGQNNVAAEEVFDKAKEFSDSANGFLELLKENTFVKNSKKFFGFASVFSEFIINAIGDDPVIEKLDSMMTEIRSYFKDLKETVEKAVTQIEAIIEDQTFKITTQVPANQLFNTLNIYMNAPDSKSLGEAQTKCKATPAYDYINSMNTLIMDNSIFKQTKPEDNSNAKFEQLSNFYNGMIKQILISAAICDSLHGKGQALEKLHPNRYDIPLKQVAEIKKKTDETKQEIKDTYWPTNVLAVANKIIGDMKDEDSGADQKIAEAIVAKLKENYPNWDDFFVGIYVGDLGDRNHAYFGSDYQTIKDKPDRHAFIFKRSKDREIKKCDIKKFINEKTLCGNPDTNLGWIPKLLSEKCPEAKFIGVMKEKSNLGVASNNADMYFFENYKKTCSAPNDLSIVVGW